MESAHRECFSGIAFELFGDAFFHFPRCLISKGNCKNMFWLNIALFN